MSFYKVAVGAVKIFYRLCFRVKIEGLENVPEEGAFVVCANHKSLLDPPLLAVCLPINLRFMAKEELFDNIFMKQLLPALGAFPVKRGAGDIGALRQAIKILKDGERLVIFPEGTRSKAGHMNEGKSGAALIATKAGVNILPIGICGKYKLFGKITVRIGELIKLDEYFGKKNSSADLQELTDGKVMPEIAGLAEVKTYEDRDC